MTGFTDRVSTVRISIIGGSVKTFDFAIQNSRRALEGEVLPMFLDDSGKTPEAFTYTTFPYCSLKHIWIHRTIFKSSNFTTRCINSLFTLKMPYLFPTATEAFKFPELRIVVRLEWSPPPTWEGLI
jgi:hypothetical protein